MAYLKQFSLILFLASLMGCGLTTAKQYLPDTKVPKDISQIALRGQVATTDARVVDFEQSMEQIQVVMFVSETCSVCRRETKALVGELLELGMPKNVRFISILIGSILVDARDWKNELKVPWTVGIDPGDGLFRTYCPEHQTPCVLLQNHSSNKISKLVGGHSTKEWRQLAGEWSY